MAIKYLDSRRISGLSTETNPSPTFEDDFSSYADQSSANTSWVSSDSQAQVDVGNDYLVFDEDGDGSPHIVYYDLGSALDDTAWVWRFKLTTNTFTMNTDPTPQIVHIRFSNNTGQRDTTTEDGIGISFRTSDGNQQYIRSEYSDGAFFGTFSNFSTTISTGTRYVEITRTSSTNFRIKLYSDSSYSTLVETKNTTIPSTVTGLRYLKIDNYDNDGTGNGRILFYIDDIKIYDGVTTAPTSGYKPSLVATQGGWVELGRTTLGSAGDSIDVTSLADKRYYMVLQDIKASGSVSPRRRLNADTGSNYSARSSGNGSADATNTSIGYFNSYTNYSTNYFMVEYLANYASKEKLSISHLVNQSTAGAGTAPSREEQVNKWANTSDPIDQFTAFNDQAGDFDTGSEVVVLGWDPSDTHTTNFWTELADVNASASSTSINTGTFTAKKYLWIQAYVNATGADITGINATVNSDTGTNYAVRVSNNGGADGTILSNDGLVLFVGGNLPQNQGGFVNMFVINNSANEKLFTGVGMKSNTVGAGNAPDRREFAQKWVTTGSQITSFQINRVTGTGTFDTTSFIKVWGSD
jgi:hypothetical protein